MRRLVVALFVLLAAFSSSPRALAQQPASPGSVQITVIDTTRSVLVGATVTVEGLDPANKGVKADPVQTSPQGIAVVPRLAAGRYAVTVEFGGFETTRLPEVRVRNNDTARQVV